MPSQLAPCPLSLSSALSPQVRTIVNLSPSTTRPPWCACPQTRTPSPRRTFLLPVTASTRLRLQPPPPTVTASTACGYSLHPLRLQPPPSTVIASITYGYSLHRLRLQPPSPTVTAFTTCGYSLHRLPGGWGVRDDGAMCVRNRMIDPTARLRASGTGANDAPPRGHVPGGWGVLDGGAIRVRNRRRST